MIEEGFSQAPRITVGDIASLAGVRSSAVSNWRKRHADFPSPVESTAGGDLFEFGAILAWLRRHDKTALPAEFSAEQSLASLVAALRSAIGHDSAVLLVMQLIVLRKMLRDEAGESSGSVRAFWDKTGVDERASLWEEIRQELSKAKPEMARILELPRAVNGDHLAHAIDVFDRIDDPELAWGDVASTILRKYQETTGIRGGYASTSESVTRLLVALIDDVSGKLYDPAGGMGMALAEACRLPVGGEWELLGQEVDQHSWRLGYLHLAATGAPFTFVAGDTLRDDRFRDLKADAVVLDPPTGQKVDLLPAADDDRWRYGIPRASTDWIWAQQLLYHLADDGIGVMVIPLAALYRGGAEASIRRLIVEDDVVDAVIELPPGVVGGGDIAQALIVFERGRSQRAKQTLFVDARQLGTTRRGKGRELATDEIFHISRTVDHWRRGWSVEEPRFARVATTGLIAETGFDLSPSRYVGYEATSILEIDMEPIGDRVERLLARSDTARTGLAVLLQEAVDGVSALERVEDADWLNARLGDVLIAEPRAGVRQDSGKEGGESLPFVTTRLVSAGAGYLESVPEETTQADVRDRIATRGDILLVSRGIDHAGAIRCATVRFDADVAYSESLMRLRVDRSRADPDFIRMFLTSRRGRAVLAAVSTGTVIANLRAAALVEVKVPLPPLEEQRRVVSAVAGLERAVAGLSRAHADADALFDSVREGIASGMYVVRDR